MKLHSNVLFQLVIGVVSPMEGSRRLVTDHRTLSVQPMGSGMVAILDELGILEGTDKGSITHDYLRSYERLLRSYRDRSITLLEIGVARGGSLRTWANFSRREISAYDCDLRWVTPIGSYNHHS